MSEDWGKEEFQETLSKTFWIKFRFQTFLWNNLSSSALPCDSSFLRYSRPISDLSETKHFTFFTVHTFYLDLWLDARIKCANKQKITWVVGKCSFSPIAEEGNSIPIAEITLKLYMTIMLQNWAAKYIKSRKSHNIKQEQWSRCHCLILAQGDYLEPNLIKLKVLLELHNLCYRRFPEDVTRA